MKLIDEQMFLFSYSGKGRYIFALKIREKRDAGLCLKHARGGHAAWSPALTLTKVFS